jgi:hypothetical protein
MGAAFFGGIGMSSSLSEHLQMQPDPEIHHLLTANFDAPMAFCLEQLAPKRLNTRFVIERPGNEEFRSAELEWRRTNLETLKTLENQWVIVEGHELIAHGSDIKAVIDQAKSKGIRTPYIFFVEPHSDDSIRIGL